MSDNRTPDSAPPALEIVDEGAMTAELDAAIRAMLCVVFQSDAGAFAQTRHWHGSAPEFSLLGREGGRILGHVGIVTRQVTCGGRPARIAGIQNLAVLSEARKSGLSRRLMTESMAEAARRGIRWGLLFCVPGLERFYASLGWRTLAVPVTEAGGDGRGSLITAKNIAMSLDLAGEPFPAGAIDLRGRDW
ncbi:MAG TPA: GNAT family N-acetyltransferase [Planctomycetota bacterium]|nr:GNAT family N-acetyltransferase [Planctomycetota bacterium]